MTASDKEKAFVRIAEKRTNKVLQDIAKIGQLASPNYIYTVEDVDTIFGAIRDETARISEKLLARVSKQQEPLFKLRPTD